MQSYQYAYTATPEDMKEFLKFTEEFNLKRAAELTPLKSLGLLTTFMTILGLVSLGFHWYLNPDGVNWPIAIAILGFLLAIASFTTQLQKRAQNYFDHIAYEEGFMLGDHNVTISDDGITEEARYSRVCVPWSSVYGLFDEPEYLFIYIGNMILFIVPKRAFPDRQEYESVYQQMQEKLAN